MRFSVVVLAAIALLSTYEGVAADQTKPSTMTSPDTAQESRRLKVSQTNDEERAFPIPGWSALKTSVAKMKSQTWYAAKKTPTQVNAELKLASAKAGSFDWQLAAYYAIYFRNIKYGPYAVDMATNNNNNNNSSNN